MALRRIVFSNVFVAGGFGSLRAVAGCLWYGAGGKGRGVSQFSAPASAETANTTRAECAVRCTAPVGRLRVPLRAWIWIDGGCGGLSGRVSEAGLEWTSG